MLAWTKVSQRLFIALPSHPERGEDSAGGVGGRDWAHTAAYPGGLLTRITGDLTTHDSFALGLLYVCHCCLMILVCSSGRYMDAEETGYMSSCIYVL